MYKVRLEVTELYAIQLQFFVFSFSYTIKSYKNLVSFFNEWYILFTFISICNRQLV